MAIFVDSKRTRTHFLKIQPNRTRTGKVRFDSLSVAHSPSLIHQKNETSLLLKQVDLKKKKQSSFQLKSCLKENNTDQNLIIENIRNTHPQSSFYVKNSSFLTEFTRVEDAQILRKINCEKLNEDSQNIGYLSFQTRNILRLPKNKDTVVKDNIDQNCISIEVIHDPSRCSSNSKSIASSNQQFSSQQQQRWYWIYSNENSLSKDCLITSNSLFYPEKSFDKNTYSITVEHNEEFR